MKIQGRGFLFETLHEQCHFKFEEFEAICNFPMSRDQKHHFEGYKCRSECDP